MVTVINSDVYKILAHHFLDKLKARASAARYLEKDYSVRLYTVGVSPKFEAYPPDISNYVDVSAPRGHLEDAYNNRDKQRTLAIVDREKVLYDSISLIHFYKTKEKYEAIKDKYKNGH